MQSIRAAGQTFSLDEDGIVHVTVDRLLTVGRAEAEASIDAVREVSAGTRRPVIIDLRGIKAMDRDAREHYAGPVTASAVSAAALLVASPLTKAIGNFFMGFNKPLSPTRMFTHEDQALTWLKTFR